MATPIKPWENNQLQNSTQMLKNSNSPGMSSYGGPQIGIGTIPRSAPPLPPLPRTTGTNYSSPFNSYMPYSSGFGYGGGYGSYNSLSLPYRSSLYGSGLGGGGYNAYGYSDFNSYSMDDAERRFIQYAEERSRHAFANVESIVRVFNSISMMLDNTFFAMTNSFRAVLSVAENFGKLRNMFGHIWNSINLFRIFNYLYRKLMWLLGKKVPNNNVTSLAWNQAINNNNNNNQLNNKNYFNNTTNSSGSSWTAFAFLGFLFSAPYIISKFLPKYEDKGDPSTWKSPGIKAKAAFDFVARAPNELTVHVNDEIQLAPTYIQEEMNLKNTGWAFAVSNGKSGVVPLNYLVLVKNPTIREEIPIPRTTTTTVHDHHHNKTKRVSFGENQIFENVDLEDYVSGKKEVNNDKKNDNKDNENNKVDDAAIKNESNESSLKV